MPAARPAEFENMREHWLLGAAANLAASWTELRDDNLRLKNALRKADQKLQSTKVKMESRLEKLRGELGAFRPFLGRLHYRSAKRDF